MAEKNLKKLWQNLSTYVDGFEVGYDDFKNDMQDEANRRRLHKNLGKIFDGFDVDFEQFSKDIKADDMIYSSPYIVAATQEPEEKKEQEQFKLPTFNDIIKDSPAEKINAFSESKGNEFNQITAPKDEFANDPLAQNIKQYAKDHPVDIMDKLQKMQQDIDETRPGYQKVFEEAKQKLIRQQQWMDPSNQTPIISDTEVDNSIKDTPEYIRYHAAMERRATDPDFRNYLEDYTKSQSEAIRSRLDEIDERKLQINRMLPSVQTQEDHRKLGKELENLTAEYRTLKSSLKALEAPSHYGDESFISNALVGAYDKATDPGFYTRGLTDIADNITKRGVKEKLVEMINNGELKTTEDCEKFFEENFTEDEKRMLTAMNLQSDINNLREGDTSWAYQSGQTTVDSAGYMLDFLITHKISAGVKKGTEKMLVKGFSKWLANSTGKSAAREFVANGLKQGTGKTAAHLAIGLTGDATATLARTSMLMSTGANITNEALEYKVDPETGKITGLTDWSRAFYLGFSSSFIENYSEMLGEHIQLKKLIQKNPKVAELTAKWSGAIGRGESASAVHSIENALSKQLKAAGYQGVVGEWLEEVAGAAMYEVRGRLGGKADDTQALENFFTTESQAVMLPSFMLPGMAKQATVMVGQGISAAGNGIENLMYRKAYSEAEKDGFDIGDKHQKADARQATEDFLSINHTDISSLRTAISNVESGNATTRERYMYDEYHDYMLKFANENHYGRVNVRFEDGTYEDGHLVGNFMYNNETGKYEGEPIFVPANGGSRRVLTPNEISSINFYFHYREREPDNYIGNNAETKNEGQNTQGENTESTTDSTEDNTSENTSENLNENDNENLNNDTNDTNGENTEDTQNTSNTENNEPVVIDENTQLSDLITEDDDVTELGTRAGIDHVDGGQVYMTNGNVYMLDNLLDTLRDNGTGTSENTYSGNTEEGADNTAGNTGEGADNTAGNTGSGGTGTAEGTFKEGSEGQPLPQGTDNTPENAGNNTGAGTEGKPEVLTGNNQGGTEGNIGTDNGPKGSLPQNEGEGKGNEGNGNVGAEEEQGIKDEDMGKYAPDFFHEMPNCIRNMKLPKGVVDFRLYYTLSRTKKKNAVTPEKTRAFFSALVNGLNELGGTLSQEERYDAFKFIGRMKSDIAYDYLAEMAEMKKMFPLFDFHLNENAEDKFLAGFDVFQTVFIDEDGVPYARYIYINPRTNEVQTGGLSEEYRERFESYLYGESEKIPLTPLTKEQQEEFDNATKRKNGNNNNDKGNAEPVVGAEQEGPAAEGNPQVQSGTMDAAPIQPVGNTAGSEGSMPGTNTDTHTEDGGNLGVPLDAGENGRAYGAETREELENRLKLQEKQVAALNDRCNELRENISGRIVAMYESIASIITSSEDRSTELKDNLLRAFGGIVRFDAKDKKYAVNATKLNESLNMNAFDDYVLKRILSEFRNIKSVNNVKTEKFKKFKADVNVQVGFTTRSTGNVYNPSTVSPFFALQSSVKSYTEYKKRLDENKKRLADLKKKIDSFGKEEGKAGRRAKEKTGNEDGIDKFDIKKDELFLNKPGGYVQAEADAYLGADGRLHFRGGKSSSATNYSIRDENGNYVKIAEYKNKYSNEEDRKQLNKLYEKAKEEKPDITYNEFIEQFISRNDEISDTIKTLAMKDREVMASIMGGMKIGRKKMNEVEQLNQLNKIINDAEQPEHTRMMASMLLPEVQKEVGKLKTAKAAGQTAAETKARNKSAEGINKKKKQAADDKKAEDEFTDKQTESIKEMAKYLLGRGYTQVEIDDREKSGELAKTFQAEKQKEAAENAIHGDGMSIEDMKKALEDYDQDLTGYTDEQIKDLYITFFVDTDYHIDYEDAVQEDQKSVVDAVISWLKDITTVITDPAAFEKNLDERAKLMTTSSGVVYGYTRNGLIYLDVTRLNATTMVHEYGHLWNKAVRAVNPKLWKRAVELAKQIPSDRTEGRTLFDDIMEDPNYSSLITVPSVEEEEMKAYLKHSGYTDEEIAEFGSEEGGLEAKFGSEYVDDNVADEVLARYVSTQGVARLNNIARHDDNVASLATKFKMFVNKFIGVIKSAFEKWTGEEMERLTLEQWSSMTLQDLMDKVKPSKMTKLSMTSDLKVGVLNINYKDVENTFLDAMQKLKNTVWDSEEEKAKNELVEKMKICLKQLYDYIDASMPVGTQFDIQRKEMMRMLRTIKDISPAEGNRAMSRKFMAAFKHIEAIELNMLERRQESWLDNLNKRIRQAVEGKLTKSQVTKNFFTDEKIARHLEDSRKLDKEDIERQIEEFDGIDLNDKDADEVMRYVCLKTALLEKEALDELNRSEGNKNAIASNKGLIADARKQMEIPGRTEEKLEELRKRINTLRKQNAVLDSERTEHLKNYYAKMGEFLTEANRVIKAGHDINKEKIYQDKQKREEMRKKAIAESENSKKQYEKNNPKYDNAGRGIRNLVHTSFDDLPHIIQKVARNMVSLEGYLNKIFVRDTILANSNFVGMQIRDNEVLIDKIHEIFGKKYSDFRDLMIDTHKKIGLYELTDKDGRSGLNYVTVGNALDFYLGWQQDDIKKVMEDQGFTQEMIDGMMSKIDSGLIKFFDYVVNEFLPEKYKEYDAEYYKKFGVHLPRPENYFPAQGDVKTYDIKSNQGNIVSVYQINETPNNIRTRTGMRRIDTTVDAMVKLETYLSSMNHWMCFHEVQENMSSILSSEQFKENVFKIGGKNLWNELVESSMWSSQFNSQYHQDELETFISKWVSLCALGKIAHRSWTAFKQIASIVAFLPYIDATPRNYAMLLARTALVPFGFGKNRRDASKLFPTIIQRFDSGNAGDDIYYNPNKNGDDKWYERLSTFGRWGLVPNKAIDVNVVAAGSLCVYESSYDKYKKEGMSDEDAKENARIDAMIAYNETQQSDERIFQAGIQRHKSAANTILRKFRNSQMLYARREVEALRDIHRITTKYHECIENEINFIKADNPEMDDEQAKKIACTRINGTLFRSIKMLISLGMAQYVFTVMGKWLAAGIMGMIAPDSGDGDDDDVPIKKDPVLEALAKGGKDKKEKKNWKQGLDDFVDNKWGRMFLDYMLIIPRGIPIVGNMVDTAVEMKEPSALLKWWSGVSLLSGDEYKEKKLDSEFDKAMNELDSSSDNDDSGDVVLNALANLHMQIKTGKEDPVLKKLAGGSTEEKEMKKASNNVKAAAYATAVALEVAPMPIEPSTVVQIMSGFIGLRDKHLDYIDILNLCSTPNSQIQPVIEEMNKHNEYNDREKIKVGQDWLKTLFNTFGYE